MQADVILKEHPPMGAPLSRSEGGTRGGASPPSYATGTNPYIWHMHASENIIIYTRSRLYIILHRSKNTPPMVYFLCIFKIGGVIKQLSCFINFK